jgi:NAD(P)-dependent dehydrogenase (short-subunit alcohol dehydrogenase family)
VALVTGGGGGIGTAMARALAGRGYRLMLADIDQTAARRVADEVDGDAVEVDVSDLASCHAMVAQTLHRLGRLDLVALNAGVNSGQRAIDPLDPLKLTRTVGINLLGVVHGIDAVTPAMAERGGSWSPPRLRPCPPRDRCRSRP